MRNETQGSGNQVASTPNPPQPLVPASTPSERQHEEAITASDPALPRSGDTNKTSSKRKSSSSNDVACWDHLTLDRAQGEVFCNYCGKIYAYGGGKIHGTTNLNKHMKVCAEHPDNVDKKQKTIVFGKSSDDGVVSTKLAEFSQEKSREALCRMIVVDELPFKFVENNGFRDFCSTSIPRFKIPSRMTVARDCKQLFEFEKTKLKSILSLNQQAVSLTTDTWTSIQNFNYMCVTGHYIDEEWVLQKKILSFALISDHKGDTIGQALENCLKDWGIFKISCVTVDNATANTSALTYLLRGMSHWNGTPVLGGEYMHMRCAAHILNLIVSDGLNMKEMDVAIGKIRAACKYVRSSPSRLACFQKCVDDVNLDSTQKVVLDVPTRWNSTYLMLNVAHKFREAFRRLEYVDNYFGTALGGEGGTPSHDDWKRVNVFIEFLHIFYDATLCFSTSLHVSSCQFFHKLCEIQTTLVEWSKSGDSLLREMAGYMQSKFDKYWDGDGSLNLMLLVAVFLDPRYKLDYVEFCLFEMYDHGNNNVKSKDIVGKLKDLIYKLYAQYERANPILTDVRGSVASSDVGLGPNDGNVDIDSTRMTKLIPFKDRFRMKAKQRQSESKKNELERYFKDEVVIVDDGEEFNILKWWKGKTTKYPILSRLARDVLAIPVSTVSSGSAFSTGGRVLDPYRSTLAPATVESLICTQNWLRQPTKGRQVDEKEVSELEKIEIDGCLIAHP